MNILWNTKIEKKTVVTRKKTGKPVKNQKQSSPVKKSAIEIFYLLIFFRPRKGLSLVIGDDDAETDTPRGPGNQKKKEKKETRCAPSSVAGDSCPALSRLTSAP